jgi:hypothetical protein
MAWSAGAILTAAQLNTYLPQAWSTWTPTITAASGTFTTVSGAGRYIQYGKTVVWSATITITTAGTAAGAVLFTLPVNAQAALGYIGDGRETTSTGAALQVFTVAATTGRAIRYDDTTAIGSGRTLLLSGAYEAV